ncbi:MAG: nucleotidyltransferase domain-containing protein [Candidatus Nezhaarchaeales archaeon]
MKLRVWKSVEVDIEELLTSLSRKVFGDCLLGLMLFGSRARGDYRDEGDYDILLLLKDYLDGDPVKTYFKAYEGLRAFREAVNRDTTVLVVFIQDLAKNISSLTIINALIEGGCSRIIPLSAAPFKLEVDLEDPLKYSIGLNQPIA